MRDSYRLLVFDWDGTLLDSVASIVACTREALERIGEPPVEDGVIRNTIGLGLPETMAMLRPDGDDGLYGRIVEAYRELWIGTYSQRAMVFAGTGEALGELAGRGHLMAVATGKSRRGLERDLDKTGLRERFQATRTVDEAPSKPAPGMLLGLLDELGVRADETLMIGDTTHDLDMAANAGVGAVAVTSGSHPEETLARCSPLAILPSVAELPAWLADGRPAAT